MPDDVHPLDLGVVPSAGVPDPQMLASERTTTLRFFGHGTGQTPGSQLAVLEAVQCMSAQFGYPNDESLAGHPLYDRGLRHYGLYEVRESSWKNALLAQNLRCFPRNPPHYDRLRHFVATFHDSTFECLAQDLVVRSIESVADLADE